MTNPFVRRSRSWTALLGTALVAALLAAPLAVGSAASAASAPAPTGGPDVTWGVRTAANDNGVNRENYGYVVDPGAQLDDALVITNHDTEPLELDLYAADGFTTSSGQLDVGTRDAEATGVGAWITLGTDHLTIQPGESAEAPFTLSVPADVTPGDYAGGIVTSLPQPVIDQGISVDRRLGIRVHLRVEGDLAPALAIEGLTVDYAGTPNPFGAGDATVSYTVRNTGNVLLSADQSVTLAGPFGILPVSAALDQVPELLPGESWQVQVPVAGVAPTFWVTATPSVTPVVAADAGLDTAEFAAVETSAGTLAVPWALLVMLLVLVAIVVLVFVVLPRRRRARQRREEARIAEAVEQALREKDTVAEKV